MGEEFDMEERPGNPRLMETFREFCSRQRQFVKKTTWPPGTKFECRRCGDCCTYNFWNFKTPPETAEILKRDGLSQPHGYWLLLGDRIRLSRPIVQEGDEYKEFIFSGLLPPGHLEFLRVTGRHHGYWVLNKRGMVVVYSPVTCIHLKEDGLCDSYEKRPRVCQAYTCGRYPIIPEDI